jgi:hypothetical protein
MSSRPTPCLSALLLCLLAGCPAPPAPRTAPAALSPPPASTAPVAPTSPYVSTAFGGQDHGDFIPDPLGGPNTQAICHKLTVKDFPPGWPAGLRLPANSYLPHPGEVVKAGAAGNYDLHDSLRLLLHVHAPHAAVEGFFSAELGELGTVTHADSPPDTGAVWTGSLRCQPRATEFAAYKVALMRLANQPGWTVAIVDVYLAQPR